MLQQVMLAPRKIEFQEIAKPEPGKGQVLISMRKIGVCGSDIHVNHGQHPFTSYPITQGHEVAGEIVALGEGVQQFRVGQKVTVEPQIVCGQCHPCRHGKYNLCTELKVMGFQAPGLAQTFVAVDEGRVTALPDEMTFDQGAMIEPLAVAVHAIRQAGDVTGLNVVVLGAGPIGNLVAQTAKGMGAKAVFITDISDLRLRIAKDCGVDFAVNTRQQAFGEALEQAFGPDGADLIYDCAGNDITMGQAIQYARKGSMIILVAVFAQRAQIDLAVANDHELCINSSMMYRHEDYVEAIALAEKGRVQLDPLMSKTFAFRDYQKAYDYIDANREETMKVLIDVQA